MMQDELDLELEAILGSGRAASLHGPLLPAVDIAAGSDRHTSCQERCFLATVCAVACRRGIVPPSE
jgi:hypothetical protein